MLPSKQLLCIKERQLLYYCKKKVAANTETKMLCKFFPNNSILHTEGMIFAKSLLPIEEQSDHYSRFLVASSLTKSLAATPYPDDLFYLQFGKSDLKFYYLTLPYTNSKSYLEKTLPHKYTYAQNMDKQQPAFSTPCQAKKLSIHVAEHLQINRKPALLLQKQMKNFKTIAQY